LWAALRAAEEEGDVATIDDARRAWLAVGEALRKNDLAVEQSRRDSGELLPRGEVERVLAGVGDAMRTALRSMVHALTPRLVSLNNVSEVEAILKDATWEEVLMSLSLVQSAPDRLPPALRLPQWAVDALQSQAMPGTIRNAPELFEDRFQVFEQCCAAVATSPPTGKPVESGLLPPSA